MTDLRQSIAEAYRIAALEAASMVEATRALESVRDAAAGEGAYYAARKDAQRQAGRGGDAGLVKALRALEEEIGRATVADDVSAVRASLAADPSAGWVEFRRRYARAIVEWQFDVCDGLTAADLPLPADAAARAAAWRDLVTAGRREEWMKVLPLFADFGADEAIAPSDRARLVARAAQVELYWNRDLAEAERRLATADEILAASTDAAPAAKAEVTCVRGQHQLEGGDHDKAVATLKAAVEQDPTLEDAYAYLGDAAAKAGDVEDAKRWYELGIARCPGSTMNVLRLAQLLGQPDRYASRRLRVEELREHMLRVTTAGLGSNLAIFADIATSNDEIEDAERLITRAIDDDPTRQEPYYSRGRLCLKRHDYAGAIAAFEQARQAQPDLFAGSAWDDVALDEAVPALLAAGASGESPVAHAALGTVLARLAGDRGRADETQSLADAIRDQIGTRAPVPLLRALCDAYRSLGRWDDAEAASAAALARDGDTAAHHDRLAGLYNARGNRAYESADYAEAVRWYREALRQTPEDAVLHGNLAGGLVRQVDDAGTVDRMADALAAYDRAIELGGANADPDYIRAREQLAHQLRVARAYGPRALHYEPLATPLGLDVGSGLLAFVVDPGTVTLSAGCEAAVQRVRERVMQASGINLPGVNFRAWDDAAPDGYLVSLDGIAVSQGTAPAGSLLLIGAPPPPGAPAAQAPATDPLSGALGYWIPAELRDRCPASATLLPPLDVALGELARAFVKNARTSLSVDDIAVLASRDAEAAGILDAPADLYRLTQLIRMLLGEGVPVQPLGPLVAIARDDEPTSMTDRVETARALDVLRARLPGNTAEHAPIVLGDAQARTIRQAIVRTDGEPALAIAPQECMEFLAEVRQQVARVNRPALIVDDDIRPFVRWVTETEFPHVPVLARRELVPDLTRAISVEAR